MQKACLCFDVFIRAGQLTGCGGGEEECDASGQPHETDESGDLVKAQDLHHGLGVQGDKTTCNGGQRPWNQRWTHNDDKYDNAYSPYHYI